MLTLKNIDHVLKIGNLSLHYFMPERTFTMYQILVFDFMAIQTYDILLHDAPEIYIQLSPDF